MPSTFWQQISHYNVVSWLFTTDNRRPSLLLDLLLLHAKSVSSSSLWCCTGDSPLVLYIAATRNKKQSASVSAFQKLVIRKTFSSGEQILLKFRAVPSLLIRPTVSSPRELLTYLKSRSGNNSPSWNHCGVFQCLKCHPILLMVFPIKIVFQIHNILKPNFTH